MAFINLWATKNSTRNCSKLKNTERFKFHKLQSLSQDLYGQNWLTNVTSTNFIKFYCIITDSKSFRNVYSKCNVIAGNDGQPTIRDNCSLFLSFSLSPTAIVSDVMPSRQHGTKTHGLHTHSNNKYWIKIFSFQLRLTHSQLSSTCAPL